MNNAEILKGYLAKERGYTQKVVEQLAARFCAHEDILDEFCLFLQTGICPQDMITEQGYTAKMLTEQFDVALPTAYNAYSYLIFLRENPDDALDMIRKGFPVK